MTGAATFRGHKHLAGNKRPRSGHGVARREWVGSEFEIIGLRDLGGISALMIVTIGVRCDQSDRQQCGSDSRNNEQASENSNRPRALPIVKAQPCFADEDHWIS